MYNQHGSRKKKKQHIYTQIALIKAVTECMICIFARVLKVQVQCSSGIKEVYINLSCALQLHWTKVKVLFHFISCKFSNCGIICKLRNNQEQSRNTNCRDH